MSIPHLNGRHRKALASIFRHPPSHNVEWHDVLALLNHIGSAAEQHSGSFDVTIGDHETILNRPKGKDLEGDQLRELKQFLTAAGFAPREDASSKTAGDRSGEDQPLWIVAIDHHRAKLFEIDDGRNARAPIVFLPDDGDGSRRRVERRQANDDGDGGRASEDAGYYNRICIRLDRHLGSFGWRNRRRRARAVIGGVRPRHISACDDSAGRQITFPANGGPAIAFA